jgi:hypothetical protein
VFRSNVGMMLDSARHYPDGLAGNMLRARRAAQDGDVAAAVVAIRRASELGFDGFSKLDEDAGLAPLRQDPRFRALVAEVAGLWIERAKARGYSTPLELRALAQAHAVRGEWREAIAVIERWRRRARRRPRCVPSSPKRGGSWRVRRGAGMARRRPDTPRSAAGRAARPRRPRAPAATAGLPLVEALCLFLVFAAIALGVYAPALEGPFVSDDLHYVATNPYVHALTPNVRQIFDPWGPASIFVVNYTPVHLLLHAVQWSFFGPAVTGHHVTNVLLHALGSVLLVAVFRASGVRRLGAMLGGALFLLHPANVEAVAWISQLKTSSCFVLSAAALLAFPSAPALATPFFFLALLAKPTASFLLPVTAVLVWVRLSRERTPMRHWLWLGLWTLGFLLLAIAQIEANRRAGTPDAGFVTEGFARIRLVSGIALRYLVMSTTSHGVSAFHEPERLLAMSDPWFLAAIPVLALVALRMLSCLRRRREESVYWVWAAASFAPISQIFPFLYPMAVFIAARPARVPCSCWVAGGTSSPLPSLPGAPAGPERPDRTQARSASCSRWQPRRSLGHRRLLVMRPGTIPKASARTCCARSRPPGRAMPRGRCAPCARRRRAATTASSSSRRSHPTSRSGAIPPSARWSTSSQRGGSLAPSASRTRRSWSSASVRSPTSRAGRMRRP